MPISGFHKGDSVFTPAGKSGTVTYVRRVQGREKVTVKYDDSISERVFDASALKLNRN